MKRQQRSKRSIYALLLLCIAISGCSPESNENRAGKTGAELFDESCGACHGVEGRGPSIAELRGLPSDELRAAIRNHPTAGQIPDRLTADRISNLIDYIEDE
jgi:mono/diheme cytochrome c family protein